MVRPLRITPALLLALSLSAALGGCGNTGDLFLPPPPAAQVPENAPNAVPPVAPPVPATEPAAPTDAGAIESTAP
ncbi:MAG: lipoprotein [Porticoccaceae bacterium]